MAGPAYAHDRHRCIIVNLCSNIPAPLHHLSAMAARDATLSALHGEHMLAEARLLF